MIYVRMLTRMHSNNCRYQRRTKVARELRNLFDTASSGVLPWHYGYLKGLE